MPFIVSYLPDMQEDMPFIVSYLPTLQVLYHGNVSGSLSAFERRFWFRALMARMSSSESENAVTAKFSAKWLGLARGMVIRSR